MALRSKIAQLPRHIREELNRRMDDGETGPIILPWLNALPPVQQLIAKHFKGIPISDQNLSVWRETGFCEWQEREEERQFLKTATEFSKEVVASTGLRLTEGAAAIAAGALMTRIEDLRRKQKAGETVDDKLDEAIEKLSTLRSGEIGRVHAEVAKDKQSLAREKHKTDRERLALDRERLELTAAKQLLELAKSGEVQKIVAGTGTNKEKIATLRKLIFPQRPAPPVNPAHPVNPVEK